MIVGICGLAGSGKNAIAEILENECGFQNIALADPMKRVARDWFNWSVDQLWGPSHLRNEPDTSRGGLSPRYFLQQIGTQVGRTLYLNTWIDYALRIANKLLQDAYSSYHATTGITSILRNSFPLKGVCISDVRFENEVLAIRAAGGHVIRVVRPGAGLAGQAGQHASETEQQGLPDSMFDAVVANDGSLEDLKVKVLELPFLLEGVT